MTPTVQNLNAKLSPRPRRVSPRVAAANRQLGSQAGILGAAVRRTPADRLGAGYLIDVRPTSIDV